MTDCSKCGDCCENIWTKFSPEERNSPDRNFDEAGKQTVEFVNKYWIHLGPDKVDGHRYSCTKFDTNTRLCTAHDERPPVCSGYPYYSRPVEEFKLATHLPARCSYQADSRINLPIVLVT